MTDQELQRRLNHLAKLANELDAEAKRRYGQQGTLFFEAGGTFHIMDGDEDEGILARQAHVRVSSTVHCRMGAGAW